MNLSLPPASFWRSRPGIALGMLLVIALFYFSREHFAHISLLLPYAILLLCPLMHLFGHHHGGQGHHHGAENIPKDDDKG
jgi:hypothetical protein